VGLGVAAVATQRPQERQLALLGPAGHRLGRHRQQLGHLSGQQIAGRLDTGVALALRCHRIPFPQPEPGQAGQGPEPDRLDRPVRACGGAGAWITLSVGRSNPTIIKTSPSVKGAQTRSCSVSVLMEETAEPVASMHSALLLLANDRQVAGLIWRL
jgi:hypothetical protein